MTPEHEARRRLAQVQELVDGVLDAWPAAPICSDWTACVEHADCVARRIRELTGVAA